MTVNERSLLIAWVLVLY